MLKAKALLLKRKQLKMIIEGDKPDPVEDIELFRSGTNREPDVCNVFELHETIVCRASRDEKERTFFLSLEIAHYLVACG